MASDPMSTTPTLREAAQAVLDLPRGTSGRIILEAHDEAMLRAALTQGAGDCPRCNGSGEDPEGFFDQSRGPDGATHDGPCRTCGGSGGAGEAVEPVAYRVRYRAEPGMIGHYPWTYIEAKRAKHRMEAHEYKGLYAAPPAQQLQQAVARALAPVKQAIRDYHYALDTRQRGDSAQSIAFNEICDHLGMHWQQGKEAAIRAKGTHD